MLSTHNGCVDGAPTLLGPATEEVSGWLHRSATNSVQYVERLGDLSVLFEPCVNVAVYRRASTPALLADASRAASMLQGARMMLSVSSGADGIHQLKEQLATLPTLAADVATLVELLADLTGSQLIGVRLAYLESAMCPRLHVDRVTLRLVTTYLGLGTEYVASEGVARAHLGSAAHGASDDESAVLLDGARIQRAAPGDVVLLKGEAWPGNAGLGAVHRSPSASERAPRVVLTLDAL